MFFGSRACLSLHVPEVLHTTPIESTVGLGTSLGPH